MLWFAGLRLGKGAVLEEEGSAVGCCSPSHTLSLRPVVCLSGPEGTSPQRRERPRGGGEDFRAKDSGIFAMRFDASIH
ncbi:hypothetical protein J4Q44_G00271850 [Coregonus suidteri]|uniref:Uncharacterized protein n=1 Tax=Coregonus suidteri TaxID=861788 RepID=A0AAN8LBN4_9TELE